MPVNNENQSEIKEKNVNIIVKDEIDVICLADLYLEIAKANILLQQIFDKLAINYTQIAKIKESLSSRSAIWNLQEAKDGLDIIIINAVLGKPQILEHKDWLVKVISINNDSN